MINFKFKGTDINNSLAFADSFVFSIARKSGKIIFLFFTLFSLLFLFGVFSRGDLSKNMLILSGVCLMLLSAGIFLSLVNNFTEKKLKNPKTLFSINEAIALPGKYNLAEIFDFRAGKFLKKSLEYSNGRGTGSLHIFYSALLNSPELDLIFSRFVLDAEEIKNFLDRELENYVSFNQDKLFEKSFEDVILESLNIAGEKNNAKIKIWDLITALSKLDESFKKVLTFSSSKPLAE